MTFTLKQLNLTTKYRNIVLEQTHGFKLLTRIFNVVGGMQCM